MIRLNYIKTTKAMKFENVDQILSLYLLLIIVIVEVTQEFNCKDESGDDWFIVYRFPKKLDRVPEARA